MKLNRSIILLILVVAFAVGYLYYSQSPQLAPIPAGQPATLTKDDLSSFKDISLNFSVLEDARFKSLRTFGESPVKPGVTGKRDLFSPF
ncbi:MAG: hypothetical protein AAB799_01095 [Patescibacteria group bacterium]